MKLEKQHPPKKKNGKKNNSYETPLRSQTYVLSFFPEEFQILHIGRYLAHKTRDKFLFECYYGLDTENIYSRVAALEHVFTIFSDFVCCLRALCSDMRI